MNPQSPSPAPKPSQIFDVMAPGKAPASPTSRPVIPSKIQVQDPDVTFKSPNTPPAPAAAPIADQPLAVLASQPAQAQPTASEAEDLGNLAMERQATVAASPGARVTGQAAPMQDIYNMQAPVVSNHPKRGVRTSVIVGLVVIFLLILAILNVLIDAQVLNLPLPHTNFF